MKFNHVNTGFSVEATSATVTTSYACCCSLAGTDACQRCKTTSWSALDYGYGSLPTVHPVPYRGNSDLADAEGLKKLFNNKEKTKGENMKTLYEVTVVSKKEEIILEKKVVAENEDEAKFLADVSEKLKEKGLKPKDVTVICYKIGNVKVEAEPQKVKIIKEDV